MQVWHVFLHDGSCAGKARPQNLAHRAVTHNADTRVHLGQYLQEHNCSGISEVLLFILCPLQASSRPSTPSEVGSESSYQSAGSRTQSSGNSARACRHRPKDRCCTMSSATFEKSYSVPLACAHHNSNHTISAMHDFCLRFLWFHRAATRMIT